jgi:hypothetical protein
MRPRKHPLHRGDPRRSRGVLTPLACAYATALALCAGATGVAAGAGQLTEITIAVSIYIGCGFTLSRLFRHQLIWRRCRPGSTIVTHVKFRAVAIWPVSLPVLVARSILNGLRGVSCPD